MAIINIVLLLLLGLLWGGNSVAMKVALKYMPPIILAGLRFTIGAIGIYLWSKLRDVELRIQRRDVFPLLVLSSLFVAQIITFNVGTKYTTAGRTSLLINTNPFFIALLSHFFIPNDRLNLSKVLGLLLAFSGVFVIFQEEMKGDAGYILGDLIMILSGLLFAVLTIYTKRIMDRFSPYKILFWEMAFGVPMFFGISLLLERTAEYKTSHSLVIALLYQSILVAVLAFIIWTTLLQKCDASRISAFLFITPIFGVALSFAILDEPMTINLLIGSFLIAGGIYIVNRQERDFRICT